MEKVKRAVDRPNGGTMYEDKDGCRYMWYEETAVPGLTRAAAWACLRKCWKGYNIAMRQDDYDRKMLYAGRIHFLRSLLNLKQSRFRGLANEYPEE